MRFTATSFALLLASVAPAGEFNKALSVGDAAPAWADLDGTDGKKHALADLKDADAVVVAFTCNSCPVAEAYEARVAALAKKYAGSKVAVVAINVNTGKADALPAMTERAAKRKLAYPYLYDPTQEVAKKFGAAYTPEFFVLDKKRVVAYQGALDDKGPPNDPTATYLDDAVAAVLAGKKPAVVETSPAAGCRIKFDKKKKDD